MKIWLDSNINTLARLGSVILLLFATFLFTKSINIWEFSPKMLKSVDYKFLAGFFSALGTWIFMEYRCWPTTEHPHDVILLKKINEIFNDDFTYFLRKHELVGAFNIEILRYFDPILLKKNSVEFEFYNMTLQKKITELIKLVDNFVNDLCAEGCDVGNQFYSVVRPDEKRGERSNTTRTKVDKFNALATNIINAYNDLMRSGKKILPSAFIQMEIDKPYPYDKNNE